MKKLFVSVPMKGRTEGEIRESIQKMKKFAELLEGEELDLIDSYVEDTPPQTNTQAIWYLGKSLEKLAEADVFIGICDSWDWNGCHIEDDIATRLGACAYNLIHSKKGRADYEFPKSIYDQKRIKGNRRSGSNT